MALKINVVLFGPHHLDEDGKIWPDPPGPTSAVEGTTAELNQHHAAAVEHLKSIGLPPPRFDDQWLRIPSTPDSDPQQHPFDCTLEGPLPEFDGDLEQTGWVLSAGGRPVRLVYVPEGQVVPDGLTVVKWHGFELIR